MDFQPAQRTQRQLASISAVQSICELTLSPWHTHTLTHNHAVCQWAVLVWKCHQYSHHHVRPGGCPHRALLIYHRLAHGGAGNWFYWDLHFPSAPQHSLTLIPSKLPCLSRTLLPNISPECLWQLLNLFLLFHYGSRRQPGVIVMTCRETLIGV